MQSNGIRGVEGRGAFLRTRKYKLGLIPTFSNAELEIN